MKWKQTTHKKVVITGKASATQPSSGTVSISRLASIQAFSIAPEVLVTPATV